MAVNLIHGDCPDALRNLPDCSVDSVVTDPPAGIAFMGKTWDGNKGGRDQWVAWLAERLAECLRVLKPGGYAVVWALPRTSGWTHRALEDAGFEVRDCITHLFGSGFPKSRSISKNIDRHAGCPRPRVDLVGGIKSGMGDDRYSAGEHSPTAPLGGTVGDVTPITPEAQQWDGWGTALKPSAEFWYLARKPLAGTVAQNVTAHGTGALNIDGCRVAHGDDVDLGAVQRQSRTAGSGWDSYQGGIIGKEIPTYKPAGRWPANTVVSHDPSCNGECVPGCPVAELDRQSGERPSSGGAAFYDGRNVYGVFKDQPDGQREIGYGDSGGASRFFPTFKYQAKPSSREKGTGLDDRNPHPTVKPVELMRWLIRLVTPPGGTVLDCFAGSGTTLVAAALEGFDSIGIEAEAEYLPVIEGRVRWAESEASRPAQLTLGGG